MMVLLTATRHGNLQEVKRILQEGADINQRFNGGQAPIITASLYNDLNAIEYLVEQGADKDVTNSIGMSALHYAVCTHDEIEVPQYLLDKGADMEVVNCRGHTALHGASHCGHIKILLLLMSYGANLYAKDTRGRLPIDLAKTEEIKQAIRDEEQNRDHRYKRIPAADLLPAPAADNDATEEAGVEQNEIDEYSGDNDDEEDDNDADQDG